MRLKSAGLLFFSLSVTGCVGSSIIGPREDAALDVAADRAGDIVEDRVPDAPADVAVDRPDVTDAARDASDVTDAADAPDVTDAASDAPASDVPVSDVPVSDVPVSDVSDASPVDVPLVDVPLTDPVLMRPGRSGAIALTRDDRIAVTANRTADTVSVLAISTGLSPAALRIAEVPTGANTEPWQVAMGPDGDSAYVLLRRGQRVAKLSRLRSALPVFGATRAVTGSEPTSMALSPTGRTLYVSNWGDGTVTVIDTATMSATGTIDLNAPLANSGMLGDGLNGRRALAHPRAIVMTNNGDANDADETLFVTEFFAMRRATGVPTGLERFDQSHQGVVYRVPVASRVVALSTIAPVTDVGFRAGDGTVAGCIPNQLYAAAIAQNKVFVTAVCESPRGPVGAIAPAVTDGGVDASTDASTDASADASADASDVPPVPPLDPTGANFRTELTGAIFAIDIATGAELTTARVLFTQRFNALYDARRDADNAGRRYPLIPIDIDFVPNASGSTATSNVAYVAAYGSDALFRVTFSATTAAFSSVGATTGNAFTDLASVTAPSTAGSGPTGVTTANLTNTNAFTVNEFTRNASAIDLTAQRVTGTAETVTLPPTANQAALRGRRFFVTGLGRWSFKGQGWNSCESCHPDGLTDNVTWFFARGPRQTLSLDATHDAMGNPRVMNWTAVFDEVADFELNVRGNSGGVGAIVHRRNDGAATPSVTNADRIIFDGTTASAPQVATATLADGLSGSIDAIASTTGTATPRSVLDDWADLRAYVTTIRTPRGPTGIASADVSAGRALFASHNCAGCHGGADWTGLGRRFYAPTATTSDRATGSLVRTSWTRPTNFPATVIPAMATFRLSPFDAANDQITCVLRNVGTWSMTGVAPAGVGVLEARANMTTASQGATGFNPPSLLGVAHNAPYFHAGNARSLEELFGDVFVGHHRAYSPAFLTGAAQATELRQIVAFLLSIDGDTVDFPVPPRVTPGTGMPFEPDPCAQFR
ncbi:MAG: hypothetical protein U0326_41830 [Polyangiales bacterium]